MTPWPVLAFSTVAFCPASPTGFVEISDDFDFDDVTVIERLSAAEILAHPHVRLLSPDDAAEARRVSESEDE